MKDFERRRLDDSNNARHFLALCAFAFVLRDSPAYPLDVECDGPRGHSAIGVTRLLTRGSDGFLILLFLDSRSHMPIGLTALVDGGDTRVAEAESAPSIQLSDYRR